LCYGMIIVVCPLLNFWVDVPRVVQYVIPFAIGGLFCMWDYYPPPLKPSGPRRGVLDCIRQLRNRPWAFYFVQLLMLVAALYFGSVPVFVMLGTDNSGTIWAPLDVIFGWWWLSLGGALIVSIALTCPPVQAFLSSSVVHFLGQISFGVYLVHYQVLILADVLICPVLTDWGFSRDATLVLSFCVIVLPFTILLAYLMTRFVDRPSIGFASAVSLVILGTDGEHARGRGDMALDRVESAFKSQALWLWISLYLFLIGLCFIPGPMTTC